MAVKDLKDSEWVQNAFMVPTFAMDQAEAQKRILTDAIYKFTDTTVGGNLVMNPAPQFTKFADIKVLGMYAKSKGMGRYYSEALDDNKQVIHMQFGIPAFNGMTSFFNSFYDPAAGYLANTGRASMLFFTIGRIAGFVTKLAYLPYFLIGSGLMKVYRFFADTQNSKYYYLKSAMPLYWNAVNSIANSIAANMGVVPRLHVPGTARVDPTGSVDGSGQPFGESAKAVAEFHKMLPDVYKKEGGIDVYRISNKAQRLNNKYREGIARAMSEEGIDGFFGLTHLPNETLRGNIKKFINGKIQDEPGLTVVTNADGTLSKEALKAENLSDDDLDKMGLTRETYKPPTTKVGMDAYLELYLNSQFGEVKTDKIDAAEDATTWDTGNAGLGDLFDADRKGGSDWVSFKVDFQGTTGESFSNNTKESDLQSQLNSMSSEIRSKRFTYSDGNLGSNALADTVEAVAGFMKNAAAGFMVELGLGGVMALTGRGLVDIPKHWDSSSASLPRMDYTVELRSPYGNKMSMFQNIYLPLAMLLAGALPLSTGKQSYTSPFLVSVHSKGRISCRLGLIESMSISRGEGNLGWTSEDQPLGVNVSFTIADLSTIMHMPINPGNSLAGNIGQTVLGSISDSARNAIDYINPRNFDEDNVFTDYLAVLGSCGIEDMIYGTNKLKLRATQRMLEFESWRSMGHFSQFVSGTFAGAIIKAFSEQGVGDDQ